MASAATTDNICAGAKSKSELRQTLLVQAHQCARAARRALRLARTADALFVEFGLRLAIADS
jgi:hypothetical protein